MSDRSRLAVANATLTWVLALGTVAVVALGTIGDRPGPPIVDPLWAGLAILVVAVAVLPAATSLSPTRVGPWPLVALAVAAPLLRGVGTEATLAALRAAGAAVGVDAPIDTAGTVAFVATFADAIALSALALVAIANVQAFTRLRLRTRFAAVVVAITTVGLAGLWAILRWAGTVYAGTAPAVGSNAALMWELAAATGGAVVAAAVVAPYFARPGRCIHPDATAPRGATPRRARRGRAVVRLTQLVLVGVLGFGLYRGDPTVLANAVGALVVVEVPALIRWELRVTLAPELTGLIGAAVLLHAVGTLGPYATVAWWDELAHAFSAAVVAAVGYALARALDTREECLRLPPAFLFAYLLLFVVAAGVVWELFEFGVGGLSQALAVPPPLTQPSLGDTVTDLAFDALGGTVVALLGTIRLRTTGRSADAAGDRETQTETGTGTGTGD